MRVVIAEDSVLLRAGLVKLLDTAGIEVAAAVGDAESLLAAVAEHMPDVIIADVRMPPSHTGEGVRAALVVRRQWPSVAGVSTWGKVNRTSEPVRHDFGAARSLAVDVGAGEAVIQAGRTSQVTLRGMLTWSLFKPVVTWSWRRGALAIAVRCGPRTPVPVPDVLGSGCWGVVLRLTVPPGLAVTAAASSGEVLAQGLAGSLRLTATTGSIEGTGLGSARVTAGLTSGEISLSFTRPPSAVAATVTSGSVQIAVPDRSRYRVASRVGSGSVTVAGGLADDSAGRQIGVSAGSGSVSVGYTGA